MHLLATALYQCPSCGRSRWGDDGNSGGLILFIIILTVIVIIVLGLIATGGSRYKA